MYRIKIFLKFETLGLELERQMGMSYNYETHCIVVEKNTFYTFTMMAQNEIQNLMNQKQLSVLFFFSCSVFDFLKVFAQLFITQAYVVIIFSELDNFSKLLSNSYFFTFVIPFNLSIINPTKIPLILFVVRYNSFMSRMVSIVLESYFRCCFPQGPRLFLVLLSVRSLNGSFFNCALISNITRTIGFLNQLATKDHKCFQLGCFDVLFLMIIRIFWLSARKIIISIMLSSHIYILLMDSRVLLSYSKENANCSLETTAARPTNSGFLHLELPGQFLTSLNSEISIVPLSNEVAYLAKHPVTFWHINFDGLIHNYMNPTDAFLCIT
uniref:Signal peptide protein n=1 Tax=Heterorhabditis bacteriophora TaxID=37862 RepID=A0A1I7WJ11_HETBA